jgi:hypothetical protein
MAEWSMAVVLKTGRIDDGKRSHSGSLTTV